MFINHVLFEDSVQGASSRPTLPAPKRLATHGRVDSIEDAQAIDVRHSTNGSWIADVQDLAIRRGERRPHWKARSIRIARLRKVNPVAGHLFGHSPICLGPAPRLLIQMIEDIPQFSE